jgi:hypothetical protein
MGNQSRNVVKQEILTASPPERAFLKQPAVPGKEEHVEHEVHAEAPEKEEVTRQTPHLAFAENQVRVVVHAERTDQLQRAPRGGEKRKREVRPRHHGHLAVPLLQGQWHVEGSFSVTATQAGGSFGDPNRPTRGRVLRGRPVRPPCERSI